MNKFDIVAQVCENAFLDERARGEKLGEFAEKLIGAVAVIVGFKLIELDRFTLSGGWQSALPNWFTIAALVALGVSLALTLRSMRIRPYWSYPRGTTLIDELKDEQITPDVARVKIARMYLNARDENADINDDRAGMLSVSGVLLLLGFVLAVASYLTGSIL